MFKSNLVGVRIRYLLSLLLIGGLCSAFIFAFNFYNADIYQLNKFNRKLVTLNETIEQVSVAGERLQNPSLGKSLNSVLDFVELHHDKLQQDIAVTREVFSQLRPEIRQEFTGITALDGDQFWIYQDMVERVGEIGDVRNIYLPNRQTSFVDFRNTRRLIDLGNPYLQPASRVTIVNRLLVSQYDSLQISYVSDQLVSASENLKSIITYFMITGAIMLLGVGLFIFLPMERMILKQLEKLTEANQKVKLADRAKSEFLANMSHEIRTPMNGVMGMAELLAKTDLDQKQKTFADIIVKSGASLLTIINDILDFSKIDAGQMELDPAPFKIGEAIEDVATLVSSKVAEKDLELVVRIDPSLPEMFVGDVGRVRQIVTNLLGNAVKFTEEGHVFIDVSGTVEHDAMASLRIAIEDTGIGIPEEKAKRVFEKFSQVDESTTRKHEGTGLGLAISSSLVELMGGDIGVTSEPGKGSTFWFEIRLPVHGSAVKRKHVPIDVSGARVLIVDDNMVNRSILLENMQAWRFDSAAAASGAEGLAVMRAMCAQGIDLDCVVLDYHMPDMNGGEVATAIRSDAALRNIPVIMLTSVDQTEDGQNFSSLGIQGHLVKPARSSLLLETIIRVLQESRDESNETREGIAMVRAIGERNVGTQGMRDETGVPLQAAQKETQKQTEKQTERQAEKETGKEQEAGTQAPVVARATTPVFTARPVAEMHGRGDVNTGGADGTDGTDDKDNGGDKGDLRHFGKQAHNERANQPIDILVAEDNEVNQIVFRQILQGAGYNFLIAENGKQAIELYKKHQPKLVCMDVSMPIMNGHEATMEIRAIEKQSGCHTPIIGVTAHAIKGDMEKCFDAGMDDYLSKPVSPDRLEQKIKKWIENAKQKHA